MIFSSIIFAVFVIQQAVAAEKKWTATFGAEDAKADGTVTFDKGEVTVNVAIPDMSALPCPAETVFTYHIHKLWANLAAKTSGNGASCAAANTGGHYDPWAACGPKTGNTFCSQQSCLTQNTCSTTSTSFPFNCEIGDLSSIGGKITLTDKALKATIKRCQYGMHGVDFANIPAGITPSIVFHCPDGTRAFCAKLTADTADESTADTPQKVDKQATATLPTEYGESTITFLSTGKVTLSVKIPADKLPTCEGGKMRFSIFNKWTPSADDSLLGDKCTDAVIGQQWDPTNQCYGLWSDSAHCTEDGAKLCGQAYTYSCSPGMNRFSCSPADLYGQCKLEVSASSGTERSCGLLPPIQMLEGKSLVVHCDKAQSGKLVVGACAKIKIVGGQVTTAGAGRVRGVGAVVVAVLAWFLV